MKIIDRIRPIAGMPEYVEFVELWNGFSETHRIAPGKAHRMMRLAGELRGIILNAAASHARHLELRRQLHDGNAEIVAIEIQRGIDSAVARELPSLHAYMLFVEASIRARRERTRPPVPTGEL